MHRAAWPDNSGQVIGAWLEAFGARVIAEHDGAVLYELLVRRKWLGGRALGVGRWAQGALGEDSLRRPMPYALCPMPYAAPYALRSYARTLMTTRRFCERPSRVLLSVAGLSSP